MEGDYGLTPEYSKLFSENTFDYIIFVSATLEPQKRAIAKEIAPIVYERQLKEIENSSVVNKTQFYYVPYILNSKENAMYLEYNKRFTSLLNEQQYVTSGGRPVHEIKQALKFLSFERLHFLAGLESSVYICDKLKLHIKANKPDAKILIFCGVTEQADKVCKYSYHTKTDDQGNLDRFNIGEIDEMSVCGKIDRGINIDGANTMIMESVTASETKMIQKLGRGKRLKVDEILDAYFLIPYYRPIFPKGAKPRPTVVLNKIHTACKRIGIENARTLILS